MGLRGRNRAWLGVAAASFCLVATAKAGDYYVYSSSDPSFQQGAELSGGDTVRLGPGRALVLIHATGSVVRLSGAASGVRIPRHQPNPHDNPYPAAIRALLAPAATTHTNEMQYSRADISSCESGSARQVDGICRRQVKTRSVAMPGSGALPSVECPAPAPDLASIAQFVEQRPECREAATQALDTYVAAQAGKAKDTPPPAARRAPR